MFRYIRFKVTTSHGAKNLKSAHSPIVAVGFKHIEGWKGTGRSSIKTKMIKRHHKDVCNDNGSREK